MDPSSSCSAPSSPQREGLPLTSDLVDGDAEEVGIGMPLRVTFESQSDGVVPLFRPDG